MRIQDRHNGHSQPEAWTPDSWRAYPAAQQPQYPDSAILAGHVAVLQARPGLVSPGEIEHLRGELEQAVSGQRFVLQGGNCAERFADCNDERLRTKLQVLLQMSMLLTYATRKPVIRIGRMAGQYAKPRSAAVELVNGVSLPVYRGDLVNSPEPDVQARQADPGRMVQGYYHAAASLNYIRGLIEGGFADLHHPERWDLSFIDQSHHADAYHRVVDGIRDAIAFMELIGASRESESLRRVDFYTSHEALLLPYEEGLTRIQADGQAYDLSAHFLWLGYRTSGPDGAHVEYLRGIRNPLGIKVGADQTTEQVLHLLSILDPDREPGRITLITRLGQEHVNNLLPPLLQAVRRSGHPVLWSCDPMHGNTENAPDGRKTRRLGAIFAELESTFRIHAEQGGFLGGVHFELTGQDVTECIGGSGGVSPEDLSQHYETACDPRLNAQQALEMAFLIARLLR